MVDILTAEESRQETERLDKQRELAGYWTMDPYRYRDLTDAWDSDQTRRVPDVGRRDDGRCIFYTGTVNGMHGDSGDGKSLGMLRFAADEIRLGHHVVWIDWEEADELTIVERLKALAVTRDAAVERFHYVCPTGVAPEIHVIQQLAADIAGWGARLVVLDSVGEALGAEGASGMKDEDMTGWMQRVPRPLAAAGAAVVLIDHVTKAGDNNLFASGTLRKKAALTGASYLVENRIPFSRAQKGMSRIVCAKDRHGHYAKGEEVALMWVTPQPDGGIEMTFVVPEIRSAEQKAATAKWQIVARVVELVGKNEGPVAQSEVKEAVGKRAADVVAAIDSAVRIGAIRSIAGSRGSKSLEWVRALEDDDFSAVTFTETDA
jgi:AAA domain